MLLDTAGKDSSKKRLLHFHGVTAARRSSAVPRYPGWNKVETGLHSLPSIGQQIEGLVPVKDGLQQLQSSGR